MNELQDFNTDRIVLLFRGNKEQIREILDILKEDLPAHAATLKEAEENHNFSGIYAAAHTLKGSLSTVGADRGSALAARLLEASDRNDLTLCRELISSLNDSVKTFLGQFEDYLRSL